MVWHRVYMQYITPFWLKNSSERRKEWLTPRIGLNGKEIPTHVYSAIVDGNITTELDQTQEQNTNKIERFVNENIRPICMSPDHRPFLSERLKPAGRTDSVVCWFVSTPQGSNRPQANSDRICFCLLIILINYPLPPCQLQDSFSLARQTARSKWTLPSTSLIPKRDLS